MIIGHIREIVRHPVKPFCGESVERTRLMDYGLYGDRSHTINDQTRPEKFLTITQFPEMVQYKARFLGQEGMEKYPNVEIVTPESKVLEWNHKEFEKEIEEKAKRKIDLVSDASSNVPLGAIEEEHVQLVTDVSIKELEQFGVKRLIIGVFVLIYLFH